MQHHKLKMGANVVITGIPRSGTSYCCTLLHNLQNCVAINEPDEEIFPHLKQTFPPFGLAEYYANLRADILAGRPVVNKIHEGKLIEDTADINQDELYMPAVSTPNFLLATKNTLMYLARLPQIAHVMPEAGIVACVRNPFDTIASWKGSFGHLAGATVEKFRVGYLGDPGLCEDAQGRLTEIAGTASPELKRALLWRHLAELILESSSYLHLVRYEDLVDDPEKQFRTLFKYLAYAPEFRPLQPFKPSSVSRKRSANLTSDDIQAIRQTCSETAWVFGYDLSEACSREID